MSKHDENCDCGCNEEVGFDVESTVTLTLDDDTVVECAILTIFPVDGKDYIALLPLDEEGENEEGEVFLYRYTEDESGEPQLANIEDDDEYELVADAFDELLDSQEFDELDSED
ncbi:DUF1292 domain-containing protein [Konateibacter massiliensis]|uniref:DUF1292 domain-containing protein n=1 Tax=Konateibacter massiliensis TaxID=2002841 RepID=UPI000C14B5F3|nr:DUF1292 domain-containing protein [Konateibacter massiliensis]